MQSLSRILAVVNEKSELRPLIEKARYLKDRTSAGELSAQLRVLQIVYDASLDWFEAPAAARQSLIDTLLEKSTRSLQGALKDAIGDTEHIECSAIWGERRWKSILTYAASHAVDLIVKAEEPGRTGLLRIRTPDDWHLIRHSKIPVLLTGDRPWREPTAVIVAVDAYDTEHATLNKTLLQTASYMSNLLSAHLHVVACYPAMQPWLVEMGGIEQYHADHQRLAAALEQSVHKLCAGADVVNANVHLLEGKASLAVAELARRIGTTLVIIGTHSRSGIQAAVLGNTSESLIAELDEDVLVLGS